MMHERDTMVNWPSCLSLSGFTLHTTILFLHISHIPPHNDHYNINTSSGRTRRTVKKKITQANLSQIKSGKGGLKENEKGEVHRMNDGSGCTVGALRCTDRN